MANTEFYEFEVISTKSFLDTESSLFGLYPSGRQVAYIIIIIIIEFIVSRTT